MKLYLIGGAYADGTPAELAEFALRVEGLYAPAQVAPPIEVTLTPRQVADLNAGVVVPARSDADVSGSPEGRKPEAGSIPADTVGIRVPPAAKRAETQRKLKLKRAALPVKVRGRGQSRAKAPASPARPAERRAVPPLGTAPRTHPTGSKLTVQMMGEAFDVYAKGESVNAFCQANHVPNAPLVNTIVTAMVTELGGQRKQGMGPDPKAVSGWSALPSSQRFILVENALRAPKSKYRVPLNTAELAAA